MTQQEIDLYIACCYHIDIGEVRHLLELGADINMPADIFGNNLLFLLIGNYWCGGCDDTIGFNEFCSFEARLFNRHNNVLCDPNLCSHRKRFCTIATRERTLEMIKLLLRSGIDIHFKPNSHVNSEDFINLSVYEYAMRFKSDKIMQPIIDLLVAQEIS
jgi:hypothetical protein